MSTRKINLSDLQGKLSSKGRASFKDEDLYNSLIELMNSEGSGEAIIWEDGHVAPNTPKAINAEQKFRGRVNSVVKQIVKATGQDFAVTVSYTEDGDMVIYKRGVKA